MKPGAQALISGTEGATGQATSVAQSRPRRTAAGGASTVQQCGGLHCNHGATGTSSRAAEMSTAGDLMCYMVQMGSQSGNPDHYPRLHRT